MKFIDFFCGAGGFTEGMKQAGHTPVLGVDLEQIALESYEANHNCEVWDKDVLNIDFKNLPRADFIIGSPPCQEFSNIGKNKGKNSDDRFLKKFIKLGSNYKFYIGENVPNIKKYLNRINSNILSANNFYLWHKRDRLFFGKYNKVKKLTRNAIFFPTPTARNLTLRNLNSTIALNQKTKMWRGNAGYPWFVARWIMGFPDDYIILGSDKEKIPQIGNAVCPPVAKAIGEALNRV